MGILEHLTEEQGADYLRVIYRNSPALLTDHLESYRSNDSYGSPILFDYPGIGRFSPVTLRYLKVVSDLERIFGDLTGMRVVEIGGGYGGQARLLLERWAVASYTIVDLEPVLWLARRYLSTSGDYPSVSFLAPGDIEAATIDLCISNYAFSELRRDVQSAYAELLVSPARRGYITCNFISALHDVDSWSKAELARLHTPSRWQSEDPETYAGNAVLIWGDDGTAGNPHRVDETIGRRSSDAVRPEAGDTQ